MPAENPKVSSWEEKPLVTLCDLKNGYAFKPTDWGPFGKPIIRIQNLNGGQDFNFFRGTIPKRYEVEPGTLLFAWSGNRGTSFGPFIWQGPTGLLNQHIFKITQKEGVDPAWFYYALDEVRQRVEREAHGAIGLVHVRKEDLLKYKVLVPGDVSEQRALALILDTVDEAIRRTEEVIEKLKRMKAGLLHDLLTRGLDENGELRDPIRHPEQFKESPLDLLPMSWSCKPLGEALQKRPRNGFSARETASFEGRYVLGLSCLTPSGFKPLQLKPIARKAYSQECALHDGDLLLSRSNTRELVALPGIYREIGYPCIYPDLMMRLLPKEELLAEFLELLLRSSTSRNQLLRFAGGTSGSMVKISAKSVCLTPVGYPSEPEQHRILQASAPIAHEIDTVEADLAKMRSLKSGLMQDLLTGRVRLKAIEEQPA